MEIQYSNRTEFFKHILIEESGLEQGAVYVALGTEPLGSVVDITDRTDFYNKVKFDENGNLLVKII
jgi:hypothetical protein